MIETPTVTPHLTEHALTEASLDALTGDPNNARLHNERNLHTIASSLQEVGAARSIVIDEDGVILAGNATAQAAQQAGLTRVQIVEADGDALIAVRRRNLTPDQKVRLALADNRANDLSSFDPLMLAGLQAEGISLDGLWTGDELDTLLAGLPDIESLPDMEDLPALTAKTASVTGESAQERGGKDGERGGNNSVGTAEGSETAFTTQRPQVSPRPPTADTEPYQAPAPAPVPGLDRVTPDQETSRAGLFLHFRALKIPVSAEEGARLDARLAEYRETAGTFYGFLGSLLGLGKETEDAEPV